MPPALATLHGNGICSQLNRLDGMLGQADGRHAYNARVLQFSDHVRPGRSGITHRFHAMAYNLVHNIHRVGLVHMEVHTEGLVG